MRNRNSIIRERPEAVRDARLIIIATEGKDTERIYFTALADAYSNPRVHVHVLKRPKDEEQNSSPAHVLGQINAYKKNYELEADDELWLVIDKDHWTESMISGVALECEKDPFMNLALSNPCFELWLMLHFVDAPNSSSEDFKLWFENRHVSRNGDPYLKVRLRKEIGSYHESEFNTELFLPHIQDAIDRARELDKNPKDRWPQTLGTRVYLLAESIIKKS